MSRLKNLKPNGLKLEYVKLKHELPEVLNSV